jgi:hypothetical protein
LCKRFNAPIDTFEIMQSAYRPNVSINAVQVALEAMIHR